MHSRPVRRFITSDDRKKMTTDKGEDFIEELSTNNLKHLIPVGGPFARASLLVRFLYHLSSIGIFVWYISVDYCISRFISTTGTQKKTENFIFSLCKIIFSLALSICCTPLAIVSFVVWFPLQLIRPRSFSYIAPANAIKNPLEKVKKENVSALPSVAPPSGGSVDSFEANFFLANGNLCLMPETAARINNLSHTVRRAKKIATFLCGKPAALQGTKDYKRRKAEETTSLCRPFSTESLDFISAKPADDIGDTQSTTSTICSITSKEQVIADSFPDYADFVCLQEVFDSRATKRLLEGLKKKYPYIIHNVSWPLHDYRLSILSSGLCIASRYPFIDIQFKAFPDGNRDDKLACKGLLMTKMYLGRSSLGLNLVGYLSTTHLQAWSRDSASRVRCKQLNLIEVWINQFLTSARTCDGAKEITVFNIVTGDFNFDKASYYDHKEQNCSFTKSFRMLISELERHRYVSSTMQRKSSLQRTGDGKRKIDYILYKDCDSVSMVIKDFKFFSGLATLTDHLPIGMSFTCQTLPPEGDS